MSLDTDGLVNEHAPFQSHDNGATDDIAEPAAKRVCTRENSEKDLSIGMENEQDLHEEKTSDSVESISNPSQATTEKRVRKKPPRRPTADSPNVCFECRTTDSKLWRRGPESKLMCNACGLRWRRSNKAKEMPKIAFRKKKNEVAEVLSPQASNPLVLPQSSIVAAQRGALINNTFASNPGLFGIRAPAQKYGQAQYQPQNMYLQQQARLAQQAPPQNKESNQSGEPIETISQAAEVLEPQRLQQNNNVIPKVDDFDTDLLRGLLEDSTNHAESSTDQEYTTMQDNVQNEVQDSPFSATQDVYTAPLPLPQVVSQEVLTAPRHDDLSQTDDFSGLLTLKAFVDNAG